MHFRFCELLQRDLDADVMSQQKLLRILYPNECCYGFSASGTSETVRKDLSIEKVRNFHQKFYRPENVCLIIAGKFSAENLLSGLAETDKILFDDFPRHSTVIPTMSTLTSNCSIDVSTQTFGDGLVYVGWRGPSAKSDPDLVLASIVLMEFLVNDPLQKVLVEKGFCCRYLLTFKFLLTTVDQIDYSKC